MAPSIVAVLRRILAAGLIAGFMAGTVVSVVQMLQIVPLILQAEVYEDAAPAHSQADQGTAAGAHEHDEEDAWAPANGLERTAFTWMANVLTGAGFGLILAAGIALAGRPVDARRGLLWGMAGYAVFAVAPALGLPPELPGMMAADLAARQAWWLLTAGATAAGLALIVFAPAKQRAARWLAGFVLMALPHLLGAPEAAVEASTVPAELAARFVVASLAASALFWAALGLVVGQVMARLQPVGAQRSAAQPA